MLVVDGLTVSYGAVRAVSNVSFSVATGEAVGLVGANGAGKSSTLLAVAGVVPARAGVIRFDGIELHALPADKRLRSGIALVPEGRHLFPNLTVAENIRAGSLSLTRWRRGEVDPAILTVFPILAERLSQRAGTLSGGEQQMLAIARAVASRPRLLMLDEPSMGLSPKIVASVVHLLRELAREREMSLLIVEQGMGVLKELTQRFYVMVNGTLTREVATGSESMEDVLTGSYFGGSR